MSHAWNIVIIVLLHVACVKLQGCDIQISGRVGLNEALNGEYLLESRRNDNKPVYFDPAGIYLYFDDTFGYWILDNVVGSSTFFAFAEDDAETPNRISNCWEVWIDTGWETDCQMSADCFESTPPPTEPPRVIDPDQEFCDIDFSGRLGMNEFLNGYYDLQNYESNNHPVYINAEDAVYLYFLAQFGRWVVGDDAGGVTFYAYADSNGNSPDQISSCWNIWLGTDFECDLNVRTVCFGDSASPISEDSASPISEETQEPGDQNCVSEQGEWEGETVASLKFNTSNECCNECLNTGDCINWMYLSRSLTCVLRGAGEKGASMPPWIRSVGATDSECQIIENQKAGGIIVDEISTFSAGECCDECGIRDDCTGFSFQQNSSKCNLLSQILRAGRATGWVYWDSAGIAQTEEPHSEIGPNDFCDIEITGRAGDNSIINGIYEFIDFHDNHPYYASQDGYYLYYLDDTARWYIGQTLGSITVSARNADTAAASPDLIAMPWQIVEDGAFVMDVLIKSKCADESQCDSVSGKWENGIVIRSTSFNEISECCIVCEETPECVKWQYQDKNNLCFLKDGGTHVDSFTWQRSL